MGTELLLRNILRVLTPEEINDLTTTSEGQVRVPLTEIIEKRLAHQSEDSDIEKGAKILPFNRKVEEKPEEEIEQEEIVVKCGDTVGAILHEFFQLTQEAEKNVFGQKRKKRKPVKAKETSTFIIEEKKKFEDTYFKSKSREVIELYKKNASLDMERQRNANEDLSKSDQSGILINKKQA